MPLALWLQDRAKSPMTSTKESLLQTTGESTITINNKNRCENLGVKNNYFGKLTGSSASPKSFPFSSNAMPALLPRIEGMPALPLKLVAGVAWRLLDALEAADAREDRDDLWLNELSP